MPLYDSKTALRFWAKVNKEGPIPIKRPDLGPCWLWTGGKSHNGYGLFWCQQIQVRAARFSWQLENEKIIAGKLQADHLCFVRDCVRPDHLEIVTGRVNLLRSSSFVAINAQKTHCLRGHLLAGDNIRVWRGMRRCMTCLMERNRRVQLVSPYARVRQRAASMVVVYENR